MTKTKVVTKKKKVVKQRVSPTQKQKKLIDISLKFNTRQADHIYGVFLVRQGLRQRSEQFMAIAISYIQAIRFCRNTLTPKYCNENERDSLHFVSNGKRLMVNYSKDLLMIKGVDFIRQEEGRTNDNPLWYWNVVKVNIIKHQEEVTNG